MVGQSGEGDFYREERAAAVDASPRSVGGDGGDGGGGEGGAKGARGKSDLWQFHTSESSHAARKMTERTSETLQYGSKERNGR
jgi:hypothetical protein